MPLTLNPVTTTFHTSCTAPLAGEGRTALSVRDAPQKLLNNTVINRNQINALKSRAHGVYNYSRYLSALEAHDPSSSWTQFFHSSQHTIRMRQAVITGEPLLIWDVPHMVSDFQLVESVMGASVLLAGGGPTQHNALGLPNTLPYTGIRRFDANATSAWWTNTATDLGGSGGGPLPYANAAAYDTEHEIPLVLNTPSPLVISGVRQQHYVYIRGETGANAVANAVHVLGVRIDYQVTALP